VRGTAEAAYHLRGGRRLEGGGGAGGLRRGHGRLDRGRRGRARVLDRRAWRRERCTAPVRRRRAEQQALGDVNGGGERREK
jgi:hypothetical protein